MSDRNQAAALALLNRVSGALATELAVLNRRFDHRDGSAWHAYCRGEITLLSYHSHLRAAAWSRRRGVERAVVAHLISEGLAERA